MRVARRSVAAFPASCARSRRYICQISTGVCERIAIRCVSLASVPFTDTLGIRRSCGREKHGFRQVRRAYSHLHALNLDTPRFRGFVQGRLHGVRDGLALGQDLGQTSRPEDRSQRAGSQLSSGMTEKQRSIIGVRIRGP